MQSCSRAFLRVPVTVQIRSPAQTSHSRAYIEQQSRDGCKTLNVDHGQKVWEMALAGAHKEQPERIRNVSAESLYSAT